ncbi:phosphate ABC transporter substrate-binding protein PstS [Sphingomonas tabacisoli]|uniref:Phosphate-binding protein PstS n=1 Tax=Sphingomonas tabacisoli TaxID=2249466 RepID=A0ABW4I5C0_9SPHN
MIRVLCLAVATALLAGCGGSGGAGGNARNISGAGATFPASIYQKWAEGYRQQTKVGLNYQAIGSGGGIKQIKASTVDFGASDKPLKADELQKAGLYQFPTVVGGVVPVINVEGLKPGQLKLTGPLLADIYLGKVKSWNDPAIASINPGVALPAKPITVVHRSDGSGTTFLFTTYLAGQSPEWAQKAGASDSIAWPTGLAGKGNDGVAAFVKQTAGSIGYVEYAYAKQNGASFAQMQNKAGGFVAPDAASFGAAAAGADWANAAGNYLLLIDQPAAGAWPITGATFILVHKEQQDAKTAQGVLKFFDWAYANGDAAAAQLDYVPLPATVKDLVRKQWATEITSGGKPVWPAK